MIFTKVPGGYERKTNVDNGSPYFVNMFTGVRWFSAETTAGKTYYYEENGNESCWVLPNVSQTIQVHENKPFCHGVPFKYFVCIRMFLTQKFQRLIQQRPKT